MKSLLAFLGGLAVGGALTAMLLLSSTSNPSVLELQKLRTVNEWQQTQIEQQSHSIASQNDTIHNLRAAALSATPTPTPAKPSPLASLADLMNTPAMHKMMATSARRMAEDNYAELMAQFHFTAEERAQFIDLLAAKQQIDMDMGMKMLKLPPDQRKGLLDQEKADKEKAEADIREFFNNDQDYATYTAYDEQRAQRSELRALEPGLKAIGQPLSAEQEKSLLDLSKAQRTAAPHSGVNKDDPTLSESAQEQLLNEQAQLQESIATGAAAFLSPEQLEVLRKSQARRLQMMKDGYEMSRAMFGK